MARRFTTAFAAALIWMLAGPAVASDRETVVHSFHGTDGAAPAGALIDVHGTLFGTTTGGGPYEGGSAFSIDPATGNETILHFFGGTNDGTSPRAALLDMGGTLYGTTALGGNGNCSSGCGTVFAIDPASGAETVVHAFQNDGHDGTGPVASLVNVDGTLYGTTMSGGSAGVGTVFSIDVSHETESVLYSFQNNNADGKYPAAPLLYFKDALYGTTESGGANNSYPCRGGCGTVFRFDPATGAETVLHSFAAGADGQQPTAGLIRAGDEFYGTTALGGAHDGGTIFQIGKDGSETVLESLCGPPRCAIGYYADSSLINVKGRFYGVARDDREEAYGLSGTAFSFDPGTGHASLLHRFPVDSKRGFGPLSGFVYVRGALYGTTSGGGRSSNCTGGCGTVYKIVL